MFGGEACVPPWHKSCASEDPAASNRINQAGLVKENTKPGRLRDGMRILTLEFLLLPLKQPYFTSITGNSTSTDKLEADGALILRPSVYQCSKGILS